MRPAAVLRALPLALMAFAGCECDGSADDEDGPGAVGGAGGAGGSSGNGFTTGTGGAGGGTTTGSGGGACGSNLTGTLRDFSASHPDFEDFLGVDPGIVLPDLGADQKPVYAGQDGNPTTTGQANFDQWFRDVEGVNASMLYTLALTPGPGGVFTFDDSDFFPLDDQLLGNEGNEHNFHFTYELHTTFLYSGGETFSFTGDDDLFTFINGRLAIDLGGVHGAMSASIDLDARAAELGLVAGEIYSLDFFFAERHTTESNFRVDTTLVFIDCGVPPE